MRHRQRGVLLEEGRGVGEVGLGEDEEGIHPGVVGGDEAPVDEARAGLGVGQGRDDDELVGVGDEHPFDRVGVVGGPAQQGHALPEPDDAGQRALGPARVADEVHLVPDDDALAAQLAGPHRDEVVVRRAVADADAVAAAVDPEDATDDGVLVLGSVLGAWARPSTVGTDADVGLVVVPGRPRHHASAWTRWSSMRCQSVVNSGIVLPTVPTSSMTMPGTARPSTAAAMTIRWSA